MFLQVENALFKIHSDFITKYSSVLRDMLDLPGACNSPVSDSTPPHTTEKRVTLNGDSYPDWEVFLSIFYREWVSPRIEPFSQFANVQFRDLFSQIKFTAEQWASILRVSHKYMMSAIESNALSGIQQSDPALDPVEMVVLSIQIDSDELYKSAIEELARRNDFLSLEKAHKIGIKATYDVMAAKISRYESEKEDMRIAYELEKRMRLSCEEDKKRILQRTRPPY